MTNQRLLLLQTHSGLHTGQPQAPDRLSRDPESGRPILRPASLLGALRKQIRDQLYSRYQDQSDWKSAANQDEHLTTLFGPPRQPGQAAEPGALAATTGQLLLLPVRSLQGGFTWVSSPGVLAALALNLATLDLEPLPELPTLHPFEALCHESHAGLLEGQHLLLEELSFQRRGDMPKLTSWLSQIGLLGGLPVAAQLPKHLVLISDTAFDHFMRYATVPMVRGQFDPEGSQRNQRLQHIEMLPPDAWLYSLLNLDGEYDWDPYLASIPSHLYLGSHRTTGHGLCALSLIPPTPTPQEAA
ncbi:MAG: hypothetical protein CVV27_07435 [Candidatus Melainabacteria bacterium HGW-Melainabacteria-1]|nr:MAG: hypothetical protein CVV27_07435 [Candidatus Melainabacteria bacterium HGW-Melainabacteria-1]